MGIQAQWFGMQSDELLQALDAFPVGAVLLVALIAVGVYITFRAYRR